MDKETITISKAEYASLKEDSDWLSDLESAGIDNSEAYEYACQLRRERLGDEED